ncbi:hypothetical protein PPTG_22621 [Phytophthora nicotianae INRA-310]|uniref:Uncharacterized protein n=1 Tax=Phytophthora nicotianae (strain INRA-310) TaxID=761204 RepID=W2QCT2_PHYN3|nr:hypothetical protein PPTG_22621 [Phytophthora nicotianae INRA-310]ETN10993.1 hypothetical protein PPTG_22621 [Phytophthora nicotianae INRA-310]
MSRVRVSVEWRYGQVVMYWTALDFKRQARSGTQPVGTMYRFTCTWSEGTKYSVKKQDLSPLSIRTSTENDGPRAKKKMKQEHEIGERQRRATDEKAKTAQENKTPAVN